MREYNKTNKRLNVADFQHPFDKAAVDAVTSIPIFPKLLSFISKNSIERMYAFGNKSSNIRITKEMSPVIFKMLEEACEMFGIEAMPEVYIQRQYEYIIPLEGIENPYILFPTSYLEAVDEDMLWAVIAAEIAGIQAKHAQIKFIDKILGTAKGVIPFGIDKALELAMNNWYRNKIYTYDRAVLLASESFELAAKHVLYGDAPDEIINNMNLDSPDNGYMEQAREFLERKGTEGIYQKLTTAFSRSQWTASRYMELYNWYMSGEYHDILERSAIS